MKQMKLGKRILATALVLSAVCLQAQDPNSERLTVPFSNPDGAKTLSVEGFWTAITVKGYSGKEAIIEARGRNINRGRREPPAGMRRIGPNNFGFTAEESSNELRLKLGPIDHGEVSIQVPMETAVKLNAVTGGNISVDGMSGEIDVNALNGDVTLTNVSGAVVAHSLNGKLLVTLNQVANKPMSFSTLNGNIDVTMPAATKADLKMKSARGDIFSDFDIQLKNSQSQSSSSITSNGRGRRIRVNFDQAMQGTINGGGPEMQFTTFNGTVIIRKK